MRTCPYKMWFIGRLPRVFRANYLFLGLYFERRPVHRRTFCRIRSRFPCFRVRLNGWFLHSVFLNRSLSCSLAQVAHLSSSGFVNRPCIPEATRIHCHLTRRIETKRNWTFGLISNPYLIQHHFSPKILPNLKSLLQFRRLLFRLSYRCQNKMST